jgi:excisionase family DNA binding protein
MTLLTLAEACGILKVSRNTLRARIQDGTIEAVNINPQGKRPTWRVNLSSLCAADPMADLKYLDFKRRCGL